MLSVHASFPLLFVIPDTYYHFCSPLSFLPPFVIPAKQSVRKYPKPVIPATHFVIPAKAGIQKLLIINDIKYALNRIKSIFSYSRTNCR